VYGKPHKNGIYRLHARGKKFKKFIDFSPLFPISIHVANSRDILVGIILLTFPPGVNFIICLILVSLFS
jgi:hypothetical protein